ncbi:MAG: hypothetical protein IJW47_01060, partial [Clostridia bacterium]|nr:hypothetical protein [Clostridia bacterium]
VIFLSGLDAEEQAFLTKLRTAFTFKRICYYGEEDQMLETIINKSFGKILVEAFTDGKNLNLKTFDCRYLLGGRALDGKIADKRFAITSVVDGINYTELTGKYSLIIAFDSVDALFGYYNPDTLISYRRSARYTDGESNGKAIYTFNG